MIASIEAMVGKVADNLRKEELSIELKAKKASASSTMPGAGERFSVYEVKWPGRDGHDKHKGQEAWRFGT